VRWVLRGLAALIVLLIAGFIVWAALLEVPSARPGGRYVIQVDPGETIVFSVVPETTDVVLVSSALVDRSAPPDARRVMELALDVSWVSPAGEIRQQERLWERTRVSAWPVRGGSWRPSSLLRDDGSWTTDTRNTILPVEELLPAGGELRVKAPLDGPPLLLRAYGGRRQEVAVSDRKREERARIARRVGVEELGLLEPDERGLALGRPRRSLAYRMQSGQPAQLRRQVRTGAPLRLTEQPVAGSTLLPGQALAVHLDGPVDVRLSLPEGLADLLVDARVDLPETVSQPSLTPQPAPPLPIAGGAQGARIRLSAPNTTLLVENRSDRVLGPVVLAVETRSPEVLAADTPAVPLQRLAPWSSAPLTLVGPDRVTIPTTHVGPDSAEPFEVDVPLGAPPLRLTVRPLLDQPDVDTRVPVRVLFLDASDTLLDLVDLAVPVHISPFERRAEDGGYVGESVPFELELPPGTTHLQVTAPTAPVRLSAQYEGPPRGRESPVVYPEWFLRYWRHALSAWHWLPPRNADALRESHQIRPVLANVRLERWEPVPDAEEQRYAILDPLPGDEGLERTWLLPGSSPDGRAWCLHPEGPPRPAPWDARARALRRGELHAILHTPGAMALGAPWRVEIDGHVEASGRLTQRIEPIRLIGLDPGARIRLVAPPGTALWLRARAGLDACDTPHRGVSAWPLERDVPMSFLVPTSGPGHRLYVGGFSSEPVTFQVELTGLAPTPEDTEAGTWTERIRLRPGESLGQRLRDPDLRLPALDPVGFQLGAAVDQVGLTITQVGGPPAWLRILTEVDATSEAPGRGAALLRRRP